MKPESLSANEQIEAFNAAAITQWTEIFSGTLKGSNANVRKMDRLAACWADQGVLRDMLSEHLSQEDERLRFAAAAYLVKYFSDETAITALRDLVSTSRTLVGVSAAAVLRTYRIE